MPVPPCIESAPAQQFNRNTRECSRLRCPALDSSIALIAAGLIASAFAALPAPRGHHAGRAALTTRHRYYEVPDFSLRTDRLRTSKVDGVVRYQMNQLPYQPGDPPRDYLAVRGG